MKAVYTKSSRFDKGLFEKNPLKNSLRIGLFAMNPRQTPTKFSRSCLGRICML